MKAFWQIVRLEFVAAVRSRTLLLLVAASVVWMFALPHLVASDGTPDGAHRIFIRYSLGAVFTLLAACLSASAAGSLAKDRAARRLQLTLVRPVRPSVVALGRAVALTAVGAIVLTLAALCALVRSDPARPCYHVLSPVMESPREEAERMYDAFMADPETPVAAKRAKRAVVLRLLTQKAFDHYQSIGTNETAEWTFPRVPADADALAVRLRFTNMFDTRDDVRGVFALGNCAAVVSNVTRSVVKVPFRLDRESRPEGPLAFRNDGANGLMLRPRRDINLLYGSTCSVFAVNLALAVVELVCLLATLIAFAMFLGAGLGRSVAVFTVLVSLFLSAAGPAVIEQYPDQLETDRRDRIGLFLTRFVGEAAAPIASFNPIDALSEDEFIEFSDAARAVALDLLLLPILLSLAAGLVLPRKQQD